MTVSRILSSMTDCPRGSHGEYDQPAAIDRLSVEIDGLIAPYRPVGETCLRPVPGSYRRLTEALIAEIGGDMTRFGLAKLASSAVGLHDAGIDVDGRGRGPARRPTFRTSAGARNPSNGRGVTPIRTTATSSMQSPPANAEPIRASVFAPQLAAQTGNVTCSP